MLSKTLSSGKGLNAYRKNYFKKSEVMEKMIWKKLPFYERGMPPRPVEIDYRDEIERYWGRKWGAQGMGKLRMVLVHRPGEEALWGKEDPAYFNLPEGLIDLERMQKQHDEFVKALKDEGVEVVYLNPKPPVLGPYGFPLRSLCFTREIFVINGGAIICRTAPAYKRGVEVLLAKKVMGLGCPILYTVHGEGSFFEASNLVWLDSTHAMIALGLRTSVEGLNEVTPILKIADIDFHVTHLPGHIRARRWQVGGLSGYFHLDMVFGMADYNIGVIYPGGLDYWALNYLERRGITLIEVPDEELRNDAQNLLPIEPGKVIIPAGNPYTTRRLRKEGVDVIEVNMSEFVKGGGGPTCTTMPLIRDPK